jgi:hypothetical protein
MNDDTTPITKGEVLLQLALGYHESNPSVPDAQERIRKGFKAIIAALRKLDFVPVADIDEFVKSVKAGDSADELLMPATLFASMLSNELFYGELRESGMLDGMDTQEEARNKHHPKFDQAMARIAALHDLHGSEAAEALPEARALWNQAFEFAPPEFMKASHDTAVELDLLPETRYVNDDGEPVYSAEQIAEKLGIPVEQVQEIIREKLGDQVQVGNVHLVQ